MAAIQIKGMSCNHCVMAVTKALSGIEGVGNVKVDLAKGEATFDEATPVDRAVIAERIRALGHQTPLSFNQMLPKTAVEEETTARTATEMVEHLARDHESLAVRLRETADAADEVDDLVTEDLMTQRLAFHEKAIWMLRAIIAT